MRKYKWGTAYSLNREHSDLLLLKRLLMGDRVDSLYAMLDESYRCVGVCVCVCVGGGGYGGGRGGG